MTSAPRSASICVAQAPAVMIVRSAMRIPCSACSIGSPLIRRRTRRLQRVGALTRIFLTSGEAVEALLGGGRLLAHEATDVAAVDETVVPRHQIEVAERLLA